MYVAGVTKCDDVNCVYYMYTSGILRGLPNFKAALIQRHDYVHDRLKAYLDNDVTFMSYELNVTDLAE